MNFAALLATGIALSLNVAADMLARGAKGDMLALAGSVSAAAEASPPEFVGLYRSESGETFFVKQVGDQLTLKRSDALGTKPMALCPAGEHSFTTSDARRVVFEQDASGHVIGLRYFASDGVVIEAARASARPVMVTIADLRAQRLAGKTLFA